MNDRPGLPFRGLRSIIIAVGVAAACVGIGYAVSAPSRSLASTGQASTSTDDTDYGVLDATHRDVLRLRLHNCLAYAFEVRARLAEQGVPARVRIYGPVTYIHGVATYHAVVTSGDWVLDFNKTFPVPEKDFSFK